MKVKLLITTLFFSVFFNCYSQSGSFRKDSLSVDRLNELAYNIRLTDPEQTLDHAKKAMNLASKIGYYNGFGEAQRVMGIGNFYLWKNERALSYYLGSLATFKKHDYKPGLAKVYNNIGNLYREIDIEKGLTYFNRSLTIANQLNMSDLIAGANLNIGIIYFRQKRYHKAQSFFEKSFNMFTELNNPVGITQSLHNQGVIYFNLKKTDLAEKTLLESIDNAKKNELNNTVASINLTLTEIYINQGKFAKAEEALNEGKAYTELVKDPKLQQDYTFTSYQLEYKRKNYKQALEYLREVYTQDSIQFNNIESQKIGLLQEQQRHMEREKQTLILIERQKTNRVMFWASVIVFILLAAVIMLLYINNKKKAKTNRQLQVLNDEVSLQKENLDRINHNLEEIITERTVDLQIKNKKLSDYSAHLSHQIRSPIATMKGLMMLEEDHLIENDEFVKEIGKCINDIDDKIRNINENLHSLENKGL